MNLQPTNPPELSYVDYHRNCRNTSRQDAIDAIGMLEVALGDLESDKYKEFLNYLDGLRDSLVMDWEE